MPRGETIPACTVGGVAGQPATHGTTAAARQQTGPGWHTPSTTHPTVWKCYSLWYHCAIIASIYFKHMCSIHEECLQDIIQQMQCGS